MLEGIALFLVGIGALLVSIVSMLRMAWLAVLIPLAIAGAAAFGIYRLGTRRPRSLALSDRRQRDHGPQRDQEKSRHIAA